MDLKVEKIQTCLYVVFKELICSQIAGNVKVEHWCKLWMNGDSLIPPVKKD